MSQTFSREFRVTLHDTDAAGVLFSSHLLRHAHDAWEELMAEIGFPLHQLIHSAALHLPLVHLEADYHLPMRHGDLLRMLLRVKRIGNQSLTIEVDFFHQDGTLAAHAETVHVALNPSSGSPCPLPAPLRQALSHYRITL